MTDIILGKDMLEHRGDFPDLPAEFFALIDPEGTNVIQEAKFMHGEWRCVCLFKFKERTPPYEVYVSIPVDTYHTIVHTIDIKHIMESFNAKH